MPSTLPKVAATNRWALGLCQIDEKAAHNRSLSSQVERSAKAQEEANAEYKEKTEAFLSHIAKFDNYMEEKEEEMKKLVSAPVLCLPRLLQRLTCVQHYWAFCSARRKRQ